MSPKEISSYPSRQRFYQRTGPFFSLYDIQAGSSDSICVWTPIHRRGQGSEEAETFSTSKFWVIQVTSGKKSMGTTFTFFHSVSLNLKLHRLKPQEKHCIWTGLGIPWREHTWSRPTSTITIYFNCTEKATCERPHQ